MASFDEHINHLKKNLDFLSQVNKNFGGYWDWQVTTCFYSCVHLVNAHIAKVANLHYRSHEEVNNILNPYSALSPCKLPEEEYSYYVNLQWLSRRSRYLISDDKNDSSNRGFFTSEKHFARAIPYLDKLMSYMATLHGITFPKYEIYSGIIKQENVSNFTILK